MKSNEFVKPDEILTTAQRTLFKALVILFLIGAASSVIMAAYIDLYNPGSSQAMIITNIAKSFMLFTVLSSLPLWIEKGIVIKKWVAYIDSITDQDFKRDEINKVLKPILKHAMLIIIMVVIACVFIQVFNPVSSETIENYIQYYSRSRV